MHPERAGSVFVLVLAVLLITTPALGYVQISSTETDSALDDRDVGRWSESDIGVIANESVVPVVGSQRPTDPDNDTLYEDINGDGVFDVVDSQALLAHLTDRSVQAHSDSYDFTGDGRVDVSDVQWLYVRAVDPPGSDPDGDGLNNTVEIRLGTNAFSNDTDGDGLSDYVETDGGNDTDTDGDGTIDARDVDSDGDLVADAIEGNADTDRDGTPDYRDPDDDGDTIRTEVEVRDGANYSYDVDFDETVNWLDSDADGDGVPDRVEGRNDSDADGMPDYLDNDRDNDGLPDSYERNVTGTDPADNDSDTDRASYDAADNGVIDGMEDFDADTLGAYREYTIGTDPFDNDTDGDGLTDGFESRHRPFDPLDEDTDDDGTLDGAADPDDDGLDNAAEDANGTLFQVADTDGEGLEDGREVELGTDPTVRDTDGDGLSDSEELTLGTDPLVADTDGDNVSDGNETYETSVAENETGVSLTLRGSGNVADDVTVDPKPGFFDGTDAAAGPTVRVTNRTGFENATIAIPIDESVPESERQDLAVYKRETSANGTWTPLNTTVVNGAAVSNVSSFSYFTVLDTDEWVNASSFDIGETIAVNESGAGEAEGCSGACETRNNTTVVLGGEPSARKITVQQDDRAYEVVPLSNGQAITDFYNYGDAEIRSPLPVAASDKSRMFFWSGPNGLSLVVVHDKPRDGSGGAVSFEFSGLPTDSGRWVVKDDPGDFRLAGAGPTSPNWSWNRDNTDGGAFRGGLNDTTISIEPRFNEAADRDPLDPGQLDGWQVLTGRATEPENRSLALDETATISVPAEPSEDESGGPTGDSGTFETSYRLQPGTDDISVVYQTEQTDVDPSASIEITGPNGATVTEQLSVGTVGTVKETINVSALEHGNVSVALSASGVNLRAQLITHRTFDTDGDGIPDEVEEKVWTMPNGPGDTFSTDPRDPDTDGDGIPDGEEVEFTREVVTVTEKNRFGVEVERTRLRTKVAFVRSNPEKVDSDGDGLTDPEERRGWETRLAINPEQGDRYAEARQNGEDANAVLFHQNVSSDPLQSDADGDGLDDDVERLAGTNPNVADSDNDTVSDGDEYYNDEDPTIHDHSAPTVQPLEVSANNAQRSSYNVTVSISDQSGYGVVRFYKKGNEQLALSEVDETANTYTRTINVNRDAVDSIVTGFKGFFLPVTMDVETVDIHDNTNRQTITGPDSFGQAADKYSSLPISPEKREFVALMGFSSGVSTAASEAVFGIVELLTDPVGYANQMGQLGAVIINNPAIVGRMPEMMAQQIREQHETRNPFGYGTLHDWFGGGWSFGYSIAIVAPAFASGGSSVLQKGLSSSRKLQRLVDAVDSAVPSRVPNGVRPGILVRAGKIDDALPETNVRTGTLSARLNELPGPRRQQVVDQFEDLGPAKRYLGDTDIDAPAKKATDLFENTGPQGRRALDALAESDDEAADVLLELGDPETQWRFVRAYDSDSVDSDELATALRRYDGLDSDGKGELEELLLRSDDGTVDFAGRSDSDTFDSIVTACRLGGVSSLASPGRLRSDRYHSVSTLSSPLLQSGDSCLPDSLGLSDSEKSNYVDALSASEDVTDGPITDGDELNDVFQDLQGRDGFDNLGEVAKEMSGDQQGFRRAAGETDLAKSFDDRADVDAGNGDVELETDIGEEQIRDEFSSYDQDTINTIVDKSTSRFKSVDVSDSDIDVNANTEIEVDGQTFDSPAAESKNWGANGPPPNVRGTDSLVDKLSTWAVAGEDEIIVAFPEEFLNAYGSRLPDFESKVRAQLRNLESDINADPDVDTEVDINTDIDVTVVSYSEVEP